MAQRQPIKIGLIGLGKMGQNHLRVLSLLKSVELVFVYDINTKAAELLGETYGVQTHADLEQLLPKVDAVVICTPTVTHGEYIRKAAGHVKKIFVEKPMADSLEEAQALSAFALENGIKIQVGFIERFNPAVQQLKSVLDKSEQVISIDFTRTNKLSARITDVDVVTDLMIHDIDLALYLNGPVRSVSAHGVAQGQMIDFASALLTHQNGRFSRIQASRITEKKIRTIQATCVDMYVDCELVRKELLINRQSEIQQQDGGPYTISAIEQTIEVRQQEALLTELQTFVAFCHAQDVEVPTAADGLHAANICDQIQKAVRQ
jgi:predicted dehydrogenase